MRPKWHILIGAFVSLILFFVFDIGLFYSSIVFLASFLIDVDHYLYYLYKKKDFSLKNSYNYFIEKEKEGFSMSKKSRDEHKRTQFIFHGIEFWLLLYLLGNFSVIFYFILLGIGIHMVLDYIDLYKKKEKFYIKISQIMVYIKNKNKKDFG